MNGFRQTLIRTAAAAVSLVLIGASSCGQPDGSTQQLTAGEASLTYLRTDDAGGWSLQEVPSS